MAKLHRGALIFGVVLLQGVTIIGAVLGLGWTEKSRPPFGSVADLQPYGDPSLNPQLRDLQPRPIDTAHDIIQNSSFISSSSLKRYLEIFPDSFAESLFSLTAQDHLVDAGAGDAVFIEQYVTLTSDADSQFKLRASLTERFSRFLSTPLDKRATATAIDLERRRIGIPELGGRFRFLAGRLFEDIPDAEIGSVSLWVDSLGVLAYTPELSRALAKYLRMLRPEGRVFLYCGEDPKLNYATQTRIQLKSGRNLTLLEWLQQIPGLGVQPQVGDVGRNKHFSLTLSLDKGATAVIPDLRLVSIKPRENATPLRWYVETGF